MKKILVAVLATVMVISTASAGRLGVGASFLDAKDGESIGIGGGARFEIPISQNNNVSLLLGGSIMTMDGKSPSSNPYENPFDPIYELDLTQIDAGLMYTLSGDSPSIIYVGGGVSYNMANIESEPFAALYGIPLLVITSEDADADEAIGWFAAGGATLPLSDAISFFAEVRYSGIVFDVEALRTSSVAGYGIGGKVDRIVNYECDLSGLGGNIGFMIEL